MTYTSLQVEQLIYTSFRQSGFALLKSANIPEQVQQVFLSPLVQSHWDTYSPPKPPYRAVYLHQLPLTTPGTLFGWLYHDGQDEFGRSDVPYFIAYYVPNRLQASQLSQILACLQQGPLECLDRLEPPPDAIQPLILQNAQDYSAARQGVELPAILRVESYHLLESQSLVNWFYAESDIAKHPRQHQNLSLSTTKLFQCEPVGAGSALREPIVLKTIEAAFPQFKLCYTEPPAGKVGSSKGIEMLIEGQLSFAQSSRGLKAQELAKAKLKGYTLEEIPVAIDGIALYVNPQVINGRLKGLTLTQVSDIFTCKVRNWKDFGGPDLKIIPITRDRHAGGTADFFFEHILQKRSFGATVRDVRDTTEGIRTVANTSGAISYATASEVINQKTILPLGIAREKGQDFIRPCGDTTCSTVNARAFADASYPITRRLFIVIKRDRKLDEQAGIAYANLMLSDEGQASVRQAGFIPLR